MLTDDERKRVLALWETYDRRTQEDMERYGEKLKNSGPSTPNVRPVSAPAGTMYITPAGGGPTAEIPVKDVSFNIETMPIDGTVDLASGTSITGTFWHRPQEIQAIYPMVIRKKLMDSILLHANFAETEKRIFFKLADPVTRKKYRGRQRYLKRYHRIGAMRRKGRSR